MRVKPPTDSTMPPLHSYALFFLSAGFSNVEGDCSRCCCTDRDFSLSLIFTRFLYKSCFLDGGSDHKVRQTNRLSESNKFKNKKEFTQQVIAEILLYCRNFRTLFLCIDFLKEVKNFSHSNSPTGIFSQKCLYRPVVEVFPQVRVQQVSSLSCSFSSCHL